MMAGVLLVGCAGSASQEDPQVGATDASGAADGTDASAAGEGADGGPDDAGDDAGEDPADGSGTGDGPSAGDAEQDADDGSADDAAPAAPPVDPAAVDADELGQVPVLMYHRLREDGGSSFDLTAEEFRGELHWLFERGYSPVRMDDLVRGEVAVAAGRKPVVLTFDDATREQAWLEDGELAADSAMGILIDVAAEYEDVEPVASLYLITSSLFGERGDGEEIVVALHEAGMELGNHTHTHANLGNLDAAGVIDELATATEEIRRIVPEAEVATMSLPYGANPQHAETLRGGPDVGHDLEAALLVGSGPAPSPYAAAFEPYAVPRIRSSPSWDGGEPDWGSKFWLELLADSSTYRPFISDGEVATISFPADYADDLADEFAERANPY